MALCCVGFPVFLAEKDIDLVKKIVSKERYKIFDMTVKKCKDVTDDNKIKLIESSVTLSGISPAKFKVIKNSIMLHFRKGKDNHFCMLYCDDDRKFVGIYDPALSFIVHDFGVYSDYYRNHKLVGYRKYPFYAINEIPL